MWGVLHYTAASKVVYANPPDWAEMMIWRKKLKPGDLFVDVGSNVGAYALWAADCGATVIAIEPDRDTAEILRENVALNRLPVTVIEGALGAAAGCLTLSQGLDSTNRLLLDHDAKGQTVPVQTLDSVLAGRTAAGVKVDVEGAERLVLEGARESLNDARVEIFQLEWNAMSQTVLHEDRAPLFEILSKYGYRLYRPDVYGFLHPTGKEFGSDVFAFAPGVDPANPCIQPVYNR